MSDARIAKALRSGARQGTGEALIGQQPVPFELVEYAPDIVSIFLAMAGELLRKVRAAMLAPSKQCDRAAQ